ncbi:MAG TPA: hypothetical protein VFE82_09075 [Ramlibacter sp.]|uniref:hypothetical protein n=1 Tax=Ramlibacter sp. TaxID=1917967 RepID=UPI002D616552|nr:hypothetical protein [Ramlibacter sp.]HZY18622.1 hypothetical protein [Ramlibacter sp.]
MLGHSVQPTDSILDTSLEDIREKMLDLLGDFGPAKFPHVTRRIRYAGDLQGLWYLRGDLMAALAAMHGEAVARERIQAITKMFRGLLPGGLASRPSPLVG